MKLSEKLIKLRKEKNLSQEEFGNQINVSRQAVSKWENEETKPDIDKIQEIVKKFNVSYEYLLNDEIEIEEINKTENIICKKSKRKIILKILLIILIIYLLISVYKFIAFTRFYLVANSFSEENYSMNMEINDIGLMGEKTSISVETRKYGNKLLEASYNFDEQNAIKSEDEAYMPYHMTFTDKDKRICYELNYDVETKMYVYRDRTKNAINNIELEELFNIDNKIKGNTLSHIPSEFKQILLASIDPSYYYVSILKNEYRITNFFDFKDRIELNNDCLVKHITLLDNSDKKTFVMFSYNYVPDHQKEITSPIESETYKDKIIFEKEI